MKEQVVEFLNNELVSYIIEVLAIFFSVTGGVMVIFKKTKELFEKASNVFKTATDNTEKTNGKLDAVTEDNKKTRLEVKDIELKLFSRLEEQEKLRKEEFAKQQEELKKQKEILENYIKQQEVLLKLPQAFAEMVKCTPEQVKTGVAKKVCDVLGLNDTVFDKAEKEKQEATTNDKVNGGE